jgi:hypothetical protein
MPESAQGKEPAGRRPRRDNLLSVWITAAMVILQIRRKMSWDHPGYHIPDHASPVSPG